MLSPEEKAKRARDRMLETAIQYSTGTYVRKFVAPTFQRMIRAEAGAHLGSYAHAVVDGEVVQVERKIGEVVCVTCGKVRPWGSDKGMHTGHFLASRRNSIVFEEDNVAPQCAHCNKFCGGAPELYRLWMMTMRGLEAIERLERLKTVSRKYEREELVDMRISYKARLVEAERVINGGE